MPEKVHLASIWLVALGSNLSAIVDFACQRLDAAPGRLYDQSTLTGRPQLVDFFALVTNPKGWLFFWHTISDGLLMASFMILAVSAYHLYRKQNVEFFKRSFVIASFVGLATSIMVFLGGHTMGQYMYDTQPMKFASIEAHWETSQPADFSLITIGDLSGKREVWSLRVPTILSFLACNNFSCEVKGVNQLQAEAQAAFGPGDYVPLMVVTYWAFRIMMTFGLLMILITALFVLAIARGDITKAKWMKWVACAADSPLPGQCLRLDPNRNGTPTLDCVWLAGHGKRRFSQSHHP